MDQIASIKKLPQGWRLEPIDSERSRIVFEGDHGQAHLVYYALFSGIMLASIELTTPQLDMIPVSQTDMMSVNYCLRGRCECDVGDMGSVIVQDGNLCFSANMARRFSYPTSHYVGFEYWIGFSELDASTNALLESLGAGPRAVCGNLCASTPAFTLHPEGELEALCQAICRELDAPEADVGALRMLTLQLLRAAGGIGPEMRIDTAAYLKRSQRDIAHAVFEAIEVSENGRVDIDAMTKSFGLSAASLRSYFSRVYGTTPAAFARTRALRHAAELLETTQRSVSDIATVVGYANPSKFSAAFRKEIGVTPLEYRRRSRFDTS